MQVFVPIKVYSHDGSSGEAILVLGASRGIDADIVRRFAADGGDVAFSWFGSQEAAEALAAETGSKTVKCDGADRDAVVALVRDRLPSTSWW